MGEEVRRMTGFEVNDNGDYNGDDERMLDWEMGLPDGEDLTPLSQLLIPAGLASAFSISPITYRTLLDVNRESQTTLSSILSTHAHVHALSSMDDNDGSNNTNLKSSMGNRDPMVIEDEEPDENGSGTDPRAKSRKLDRTEEADSVMRTDNSNEDPSAETLKRPRLAWTPQLHKRFVDVVGHIGIKNAVPKTIMQMMNVEGLTRENVASHLQKYRLYLKRMQGGSNDDQFSSDHQLFSSDPVPPQRLRYESTNGGNGGPHGGPVSNGKNNNNRNSSSNNNGNGNNGNGNKGQVGMAVYGTPEAMMSVPMYGMMNHHQGFYHGHGFDPSMYNMNMNMGMFMNMGMNNMTHHQKDWSLNEHGHGSVPHSSDE